MSLPTSTAGSRPVEPFGVRVAAEIAGRALTQRQLARDAGLNVSTVSRVLSGSRRPGPAVVRRLSAALGCSVEHLCEGTDVDATAAVDASAPLQSVVYRLVQQLGRLQARVHALEVELDRAQVAENQVIEALDQFVRRRKRKIGRTADGKGPAIYPCGCSHHKVGSGRCDIYASDGSLRPDRKCGAA